MSRRFAHAPAYTAARGRVRVTCTCGWPGSRHDTHTLAEAAYDVHVGHREHKNRRHVSLELTETEEMIGVEMLFTSARFPPIQLH